MAAPKLAFAAADTHEAQAALIRLQGCYESVPENQAEIIVALGGDGFMLHILHQHMNTKAKIYGMNCGTVGFLMNAFEEENLLARMQAAEPVVLKPLAMTAERQDGSHVEGLAINEVSLLRQTRQAAKLRIRIDGRVRLEEMVCDGCLVATPAGSTAYNLSAHGPILPMGTPLLALTPISAFRPRRWRGALLPNSAEVTIEILDCQKRPVSATADDLEVRDVVRVTVKEASDTSATLLFDPEHNLEERILGEQFIP